METVWIGAHTSAQGGVSNALLEGESIGATAIQLFTANQRRWVSKDLEKKEIERFKEIRSKSPIGFVMSHDSYLINLASNKEDIREKSLDAFKRELERCHALEVDFLNFHPGAAGTQSKEEGLDKIVEALLSFEKLAGQGSTRLLFETTAGQGTVLGASFEEIGYLIDRTKDVLPIGVCIDTCHIFVAGYDIHTRQGVEKVLKEFDEKVGLEYLYAFHLNDAQKGCGSKLDRHADLGKGEIGWECFKWLMQHPHTKKLPKFLETPGGIPVWREEIKQLKSYAYEDTCFKECPR